MSATLAKECRRWWANHWRRGEVEFGFGTVVAAAAELVTATAPDGSIPRSRPAWSISPAVGGRVEVWPGELGVRRPRGMSAHTAL